MEHTRFLELTRIALGNGSGTDFKLDEKEFIECFREAKRQTLLGVLLNPVVGAIDESVSYELLSNTKFQWISCALMIESNNRLLDSRAGEITKKFSDLGLESCVIKGQSVARYYPDPKLRQPGDIDLWVDGDRRRIVKAAARIGKVENIVYHHFELRCFPDVSIEVHFYPSWFFSPIVNRRFHKWLNTIKHCQFVNREKDGFASPDINFDLVFSLIHIYRHVFDGGIGLRQLMDYYYILINSSRQQRKTAFDVIRHLRMSTFCAGIMYVLKSDFLMDDQYLLTVPSEKYGQQINEQVFAGGNFGVGDKRNSNRHKSLWHGLMWTLHNSSRLVKYYPSEALWTPFFKGWQWIMRCIWNMCL